MSTTNPDVARATWRRRLAPAGGILAILGVLSAPAIWVFYAVTKSQDAGGILLFVFVSVGFGLYGYYVVRPTPWILAAYIVAYVGGLFLVLSAGVPAQDASSAIHNGFWIVAPPYAVAAFCLVMYVRRHAAVLATRDHGIDTTATIESIGVDGQVNYIQHQHMTLSFIDDKNTKGYFHTGITGGYYGPGDTIPIRYDPDHPESKRYIIVGGQPYVSPDQQP